jgi:hypothetical protein
MKLFTKDIDTKLFEQYAKGSDLENQMVVAKIFNPYGNGTWYLLNSDPEDPEYIWAIVDMGDIEVGSVNRSDLENIRIRPFMLGLERDLSFRPVNALELYKGVNQGKHYAKGGGVDNENREMVLNNNKQIAHHTKEMSAAVRNSKYVPAWVVAKVNRSATDLSDATHYMEGEGESYANGGGVGNYKVNAFIFNDDNQPKKEFYFYAKNDNEAENKLNELLGKEYYQLVKVYRGDISMTFENGKLNWDKKEKGGNTGGTSDSAEMNAPTLGGTMTSSMATGGGVQQPSYAIKLSELLNKYEPTLIGISRGMVQVTPSMAYSGAELSNMFKGFGDSMDIKNIVYRSLRDKESYPIVEKLTKGKYKLIKPTWSDNFEDYYFDNITKKEKGGGTKKEFIAKKVGKVMREFKDGDLHIGTSNKIVKNPKQAIAIGLSEGNKGWKHRRK